MDQIAFIRKGTYAIIGEYTSLSGQFIHWPMPQVECPVVDASNLPRSNVYEICMKFVTPAGVSDVEALIATLLKAGAKVGDYKTFVLDAGLNERAAAIPINLAMAKEHRAEVEVLHDLGYEV